jgi:hypothetical protein
MGAFRSVIDFSDKETASDVYDKYTNYMLYRNADYTYGYCEKGKYEYDPTKIHQYDKCNDIEYYSYSGYFDSVFPEASISGVRYIITNTGLIGIFYCIGNLPNIGSSPSSYDRMVLIIYDILYSSTNEADAAAISDIAKEDRMQKLRFDHDGLSKDFICVVSSSSDQSLSFYNPAPVLIDASNGYVFFDSKMDLDGINSIHASPTYGDYFCGISAYPTDVPSEELVLMPKKEYSIHIHCDSAIEESVTAIMSYGTSYSGGSIEEHALGKIQSDGSLDRSIFYKGSMTDGSSGNKRMFIRFRLEGAAAGTPVYMEVR